MKTMSDAVIVIINGYKKGNRFHGNELHNDVAKIFPEAGNMYTDTILRMARRHCRGSFRPVNHNKSLYEKV